MVVGVGLGVASPFSKSPIHGIFPQASHADHPLTNSSTESSSMPKNTNESVPQEQPMDVDYQMDDIDDACGDADSYGSDFESIGDDLPQYPTLEQQSEGGLKPTAARGGPLVGFPQIGPAERDITTQPSLLDDNCIVCRRPKEFKDVPICGDRNCDLRMKSWQGLASSEHGPGSLSSSRCPMCHNSKRSADKICGSEDCRRRLRFSEGFSNPRLTFASNGPPTSSYSAAVQTRSQTRAGGMCAVCHQRPRYSQNGKTYPTCGLTCAAKLNPSGKVEMCDFCRQRPKVVLNGRIYPHCGTSCRDKARDAANNGGTGTCTTCLNCWKAPAELLKDEFCSDSCRAIIEHRAPLLLEVPRGHASFNEVEKEFKSCWTLRKAPCPTIKKIYMVCIPAKQAANFEDFGKRLLSSYGMPGNLFGRKKEREEFRWIPGVRNCPLGHPGMLTPCEIPQCQLCNILRGTFIPEILGRGISTMPLPRAVQNHDHWASNNIPFKTSKMVLLSRVHLGKVVELDSFQVRPVPPQGAHSVKVVNYAQNHSRVDFNEIVVYSCEALRPVYLITYD